MAARRVRRLRGHDAAVLCCQLQPQGGSLAATAGEDGRVGLFDLRTKEAMRVLHHFGEEAATALSFSPAAGREHILFTSSGSTVLMFDLRQGDAAEPLQRYNFNTDEINWLTVNKKGSFLAAADDSGQVKVIDLCRNTVHKTLRGGHVNVCSSALFHPRRPWEILTGGLDCQIIKWDFSSGKQRAKWNFSEEGSGQEESSQGLCNPPFVHALSLVPSELHGEGGFLLAAARGDGAVALCETEITEREQRGQRRSPSTPPPRRGRVLLDASLGGHSSTASHVVYARFAGDSSFIVSGGNDRRVLLWNWAAALRQTQGSEEASGELLALQIPHGKKVNWLASSDGAHGGLLVADTSSSVSVYSVL